MKQNFAHALWAQERENYLWIFNFLPNYKLGYVLKKNQIKIKFL